jgi:hypothetical protein
VREFFEKSSGICRSLRGTAVPREGRCRDLGVATQQSDSAVGSDEVAGVAAEIDA